MRESTRSKQDKRNGTVIKLCFKLAYKYGPGYMMVRRGEGFDLA